ncbi:hypothetical protein F8388_003977, partial [Cannabis sativa]
FAFLLLISFKVLERDIPWETYMTTNFISRTCLQLLRNYDKKPHDYKAQLLQEDGLSYVGEFLNILENIHKQETVEYVVALIDEMIQANSERAKLFHDKSLSIEKTYSLFLRLLMNNSQFVQEKSCKILTSIVSARQKIINGETSNLKKTSPNTNDVLKCLVNWLCAELQLKKPLPSNLSRSSPTAISCLATLLKEPVVKAFFVHSNGVRLLVPFINPPFIQPSIQLVYETCFCVWLLSYYESAIEHLATSKALPRLMDVAKNSTAEKVVRVVIMTFQNMLAKGIFDSQMIQLDLSELVQSLKIQIWSDEDLLDALNQVDENLNKIKTLKSFEIYKQEVLLGRLYWTSIRKDSAFWSNNIAHFEENNFQILRVLITILDTSCDPRALAVACFDLSQFIKHHIDGRFIVTKLNAKERVMKLLDHKNDEVTKNALLCTQRLLLGRKYANFF